MKNYTSGVPVETTIAKIEKILAKAGATGVSKQYTDGEVTSLQFTIYEPSTKKQIAICLPANVEAVKRSLFLGVRRPRSRTSRSLSTEDRIEQQAGRTAWKIVQDWVEVQLSLIEMGQAEIMQVFLPYVWDGRQTLFGAIKQSGFKALTSGSGFRMLTEGKGD